MTLNQAGQLQRRIRRLSKQAGFMRQMSRRWATPPGELPLAFLPHKFWRHWWSLSETALLAEDALHSICWDEPARPVKLWYATGAA